jgi:hypothetical protein
MVVVCNKLATFGRAKEAEICPKRAPVARDAPS